MAEILSKNNYLEFESFVSKHPRGSFYQSINWARVKNNWQHEIVVSRDKNNKIIGGASILLQKIPYFNTTFLYCPRGPVCELHDEQVLSDLVFQINGLANLHHAHLFKMDPNVAISDEKFLNITKKLNFSHFTGGQNFETIQSRFNYRLYIKNRSLDQLLASFHPKTRYNIKVAIKHGVSVKVCSKNYLDDFISLMKITGQRDGFNIRPKSYFERMIDSLGPNVRLYLAFYDQKPIAGAITTNYAGQTCYVYGASDNAHRNVMPNYLLQWEMIKWAVETNCYVYDFQGVSGDISNPNNPLFGLYRFKKGFNGQLDELAGEFNLVYKPFINRSINLIIDFKSNLSHMKSNLKSPVKSHIKSNISSRKNPKSQ